MGWMSLHLLHSSAIRTRDVWRSIKMRSSPANRRALFDVAVAGLVIAIPALLLRLRFSSVTAGSDGTVSPGLLHGATVGSSILLTCLRSFRSETLLSTERLCSLVRWHSRFVGICLRTEPNRLLPNATIYVPEAPWQWIMGQSGGTISRTAPGVAS
jgi:hypothetical protein